MQVFEIEDNAIIYNNTRMKKSREFEDEGKEYIQFVNHQQHKFIVMEKITDNNCIEINDKELLKTIIEKNLKKASNIIE